jgi:hypothetical protein
MGLLGFHRFFAAAILFSLSCLVVAVQLLMRWFEMAKGQTWKVPFIILTFVWVAACELYGIGVVTDSRDEYYAGQVQTLARVPSGQKKPEPPFATQVELAIVSFKGKDYNTGIWVAYQTPNGCTLYPTHLVLFIRITNMQSVPIMVTGYNLGDGRKNLIRVKIDTNPVFVLSAPYAGKFSEHTLQFYRGTTLVSNPAQDAERRHALLLGLNALDSQIGDKYVEPHRSVWGWAFFEYPGSGVSIPAGLRIFITDQLGNTYSYPAPMPGGDPSGDATPRHLTVERVVNLSRCNLATEIGKP